MDGLKGIGGGRTQLAAIRALWRRGRPYLVLFLLVAATTRLTLALRVRGDYAADLPAYLRPFVIGAWYDLVVFSAFAVPIILWWLLIPRRLAGGRFDRLSTRLGFFCLALLLVVTSVAEHLFWTEFGTRFNFIAVDYLVYTSEVLGNIWESYPVPWLLACAAAIALGMTWVARRQLTPARTSQRMSQRVPIALAALASVAAMLGATSQRLAVGSTNAINNELALNGVWSLFSAYRHNEIDYRRFYRTIDEARVGERFARLIAEPGAPLADPGKDKLTRIIRRDGPMIRKNIVIVGMESMGAEYLGHFGNEAGLTPTLDRLADEGLHFTKLLATGTRTVRGLEAITLSVPPTPGQSIVRRPGNENLYSLGFVLRERGYDARFIYGGYGTFDNMNAFFAVNGFDVTDRTSMAKEEVRFANVWGVSDEDLFGRALAEADRSHATGRNFLQFVMTTSNHRPFTYPDGKIDIFSKSGRNGGVKYADFAIGRFVEAARAKPWFENTVFVFVGDHTAGTSGKIEIDPSRYHVAALIWSPGFVEPRRFERLASQIDIAPTLLGLLNVSYRSRFYGRDVLRDPDAPGRAYIGIYQKVALVRGDEVVVLGPKSTVEAFEGLTRRKKSAIDSTLVDDAIATYQFASDWALRSRRVDSRLDH